MSTHQMRRNRSSELSSTVVAVSVTNMFMTPSFVLFDDPCLQQLSYHRHLREPQVRIGFDFRYFR